MKINRFFAAFLLMLVIFTMLPTSVLAAGSCDWTSKAAGGIKDEVATFYKAYNQDAFVAMIKDSGPKYPTSSELATEEAKIQKYAYSITYVTNGNVVCNLYADEIPHDFGLWNTNITINDGRVVVTGVNGDTVSAWNLIYEKYRLFIMGIAGAGAITCVLAFVLFFMKMGANAGNPGERAKTLTMLLFTGAGAAGLGAVTIFFGFFWNIV